MHEHRKRIQTDSVGNWMRVFLLMKQIFVGSIYRICLKDIQSRSWMRLVELAGIYTPTLWARLWDDSKKEYSHPARERPFYCLVSLLAQKLYRTTLLPDDVKFRRFRCKSWRQIKRMGEIHWNCRLKSERINHGTFALNKQKRETSWVNFKVRVLPKCIS